jgi:DNA-binding HxlR family transcriptional regulator
MNKKWIMVILKTMSDGGESFNQIKSEIGDINQKILTARLTELEETGFIKREIVQEKPVKIRYSLTEKGCSFCGQIKNLLEWQEKWGKVSNNK